MTPAGWARVVLAVHFAYVAGVALPVPLVLIGWPRGWRLARGNWLRTANLILSAPILLEIVMGERCPLTIIGNELRLAAGEPPFAGGFINHWLAHAMTHPPPDWLVSALSASFVALVLVLYWTMPPRWLEARRSQIADRSRPYTQ